MEEGATSLRQECGGGLQLSRLWGYPQTGVEGQLPSLGGSQTKTGPPRQAALLCEVPLSPQPSSPQIRSPSAPLPGLAPACCLESQSWGGAGRVVVSRHALCSVPQGGSSRKHAAERLGALPGSSRPCEALLRLLKTSLLAVSALGSRW